MTLEIQLVEKAQLALKELYGQDIEAKQIPVQQTRKDLEGDFTIVVFGFTRLSKKSPEQTAEELGQKMLAAEPFIDSFNVIKGFLNFVIKDDYYLNILENIVNAQKYGFTPMDEKDVLVLEYSSPNTNKPLHLGHIRNNLLGWSVAELLKANGKNVKKVNLINDRGIHICKSMLAWQKWGENKTPESTDTKGDKFVGDYYVLFDQKYKVEIKTLVESGIEEDVAKKQAPLMLEAQEMLLKWEAGDKKVYELWTRMNQWVYDGFDITYANMGVDFDKVYHESETYLLGKKLVEEGLEKGILFKKENGSVWCDLTDEGMDEKLLLRADGTSVYMTQDLGTAQLRQEDYSPNEMIYVVGNEQNYHFDVLKIVLQKLSKEWAKNIHHLSYGMVELPHGKMKSREGTVVDADDLMQEMYDTAKATTEELGKIEDFTIEEAAELYKTVSLGALKYFILKVDPKKQMMFNPAESIDFNGNTGPFIQYTYARIQSIIRKAHENGISAHYNGNLKLEAKEKALVKHLGNYTAAIKQAGEHYSPSMVANYIFELVKEYNKFYQEHSIMKEEDTNKQAFRVELSKQVAGVIASGMSILGIQVPNRM
ncbi:MULTISPECIES: arginine--tRNA ligase [unclassified Lentimicrobium]|uniref:arginine--tRNA ligase n=1 Tax=unclassified Lentimicrobium TaxID=2677434 RepID=UPI001557BB1C|nr:MULTISPECIES: arginine--tRNA ligase [unclassified Lentimicrobium]NPD45992.1 arginine--tRNA ligase [Lentimicrobium sp. S6]NPD86784.1 arginine--tRNA ligase [Lentimicrobium sp. L6]